jgi:hypothetical protein
VAGLRARSEKFANELLTDQAKNDTSGKPYAWARARLCRMPADQFPMTEHANAVGADSGGRVSAKGSAAFKALTQVTASGKVVGANDARFGVPGNELSNHGAGTEIVLMVGGAERRSPSPPMPPLISPLAGEGSPYVDSAGRVRASPPPPPPASSDSAAGVIPFIDDAGRVVSARRRVVMQPAAPAPPAMAPLVSERSTPSVNERPALGRAFTAVQRATGDLMGMARGPVLHLLLLLFLVACGWVAGKAHGYAADEFSACRSLHEMPAAACGTYAFDPWSGWSSTTVDTSHAAFTPVVSGRRSRRWSTALLAGFS